MGGHECCWRSLDRDFYWEIFFVSYQDMMIRHRIKNTFQIKILLLWTHSFWHDYADKSWVIILFQNRNSHDQLTPFWQGRPLPSAIYQRLSPTHGFATSVHILRRLVLGWESVLVLGTWYNVPVVHGTGYWMVILLKYSCLGENWYWHLIPCTGTWIWSNIIALLKMLYIHQVFQS